MSAPEALALFDEGVAAGNPLVLAARLDRDALRTRAEEGLLPAVMRALVPRGGRPAGTAGESRDSRGLLDQLAGMAAAERTQMLVSVVRKHAAAVLGRGSLSARDDDLGFMDMGFDSLTAVELRNRIAAACGLRLPATLIFDYPTPMELGRWLHEQLSPAPEAPAQAPETEAENGGRPSDDNDIDVVEAMDVDELIRAVRSTEE
jgi:acyl carrier protein